MIEYVFIFTLIAVILMLVIDRYFIVEQHQKDMTKLLDELSRATKAVISRNAHEYVMTSSIDKVVKDEEKEVEPDEIQEEALNDEDFFKVIGQTLKPTKN